MTEYVIEFEGSEEVFDELVETVEEEVDESDGVLNENDLHAVLRDEEIVEEGDELVKKSDAEEAIKKARKEERQRILDKVETIYEKYSEGNTLFYSDERSAIRPFVEDLRDELEEEVEQS
jgi:hypothetical protein